MSLTEDTLATSWLPIDQAKRDGSFIVGYREGWDWPQLLRWKINSRTGDEYFGDPDEMDDYDLIEEGPTHFLPVPDFGRMSWAYDMKLFEQWCTDTRRHLDEPA